MRRYHVTGRILHNHKLYQGPSDQNPSGDIIEFDDDVSEEHIQSLRELGHIGGPEARSLARKAAVQEEVTGMTGLTNQEEAALWRSSTGLPLDRALARERREAQIKEEGEGQRKSNIDAANPANTAPSQDFAEHERLVAAQQEGQDKMQETGKEEAREHEDVLKAREESALDQFPETAEQPAQDQTKPQKSQGVRETGSNLRAK